MSGALLVAVVLGGANSAWAAGKKSGGKKSGDASCVDKDDPPEFPWQKFKSGETCVEFTNTLTYVYQRLLRSSGSVTGTSRRTTASSDHPEAKTLTYESSLETTTPTKLGDLKTSFDVKFERSAGDTYIYTTLNEGAVSLAGATVGYTDSAMNFWSGDFQFSAASPSRTVGVARYEYEVIPNGKLGLSLETGVPTSSTNSKLVAPIYPDDKVLAARWLYETDPLSVQFSGMIHRATVARERQLPIANPEDHFNGWAVTAGTTFEVTPISEDDEISAQATYAVNASSYLGTNSDLSTLASRLPFSVDTRGWSAVASYHRQWTERWESNLFVSYLALDISTPLGGDPQFRSTRYAANVAFKPDDAVRVGAELGYLDVQIERRGLLGILRGASGKGLTGYLFAELNF